MDQSQPKHLSPWIAWSLVVLFAGVAAFCTWEYYFQISNVYDNQAFFGVKVHKTTTPTTTNSATANWKTYTNTTYKYSFKYPTILAPTTGVSKDSEVVLSEGGNDKWSYIVTTANNSDNKTLAQLADNQTKTKPKDFTVTDATVGNLAAKKVVDNTATDHGDTTIYIINGSNIITIQGDESNATSKTELANLLSTFQFTK